MTDLGTLLVDGNGTGPRNWVPGAPQDYTNIDESIAAANDSDNILAPQKTNDVDTSFTLQNTPSDFATMDSLSINIRYKRNNLVDDVLGLSARIVNGATILAAADSGGTFQVITADISSTSYQNSGALSFTYVNTTANKATWDGAEIEIRQTYSQVMAAENVQASVSALELTGTYTITVMTLGQDRFRFRTVNAITAGSFAAFDASDPAVDTDISIEVDTVFRVRFLLQANDSTDGTQERRFQLRYSLNGAAYAAVTDSTPIQAAGSVITGYAEDATAGTSIFGSGSIIGGFVTKTDAIVPTSGTQSWADGVRNANHEFGLILDSGQVSNDDTIDLRIYEDDGTPLDAYTVTPRVTAEVAGNDGTLAETQDNQTLAASGSITVTGSLAETQDAQTLSASGTVTSTGSLAETQDDQTLSASGSSGITVTGSLAETQDDQTLAASGTVVSTGSLVETQDDQTLAASGTITSTGSLAETQADQTLSAAGHITSTGSLAETQADQTLSASGSVGGVISGSLAETQDDQTLSATGHITSTGSLAETQADQTLAASGAVGDVTVGSLDETQDDQTLAASGHLTSTGSLAETQDDQTLAASGHITSIGSLAETQADQTLAASGTVGDVSVGSLAETQADQTLVASGVVTSTGSLAETQADQTLVASGSVQEPATGTVSVTQADQTLVASGFITVTGSLAVTQADQTLVASGGVPAGGVGGRLHGRDTDMLGAIEPAGLSSVPGGVI